MATNCVSREYRKTNRVAQAIYRRRYNAENRERRTQYNRMYYELNKDRLNESSRQYREKNKASIKDSFNAWRARNPERDIARTQHRRARKKGNGGEYTADEWKALCQQYNNCCLACNRDDVTLTVDHVIPLIRGGSNDISNIQPLCKSCNSKKNTKIIDYRYKPGVLRWIQKKLFG